MAYAFPWFPQSRRRPGAGLPALALAAAAVLWPGAPKAEASKPLAGRQAPAFSLPRLEAGGKGPAEAVSLASLQGRVVLLDFWATWCAPCKRTLPELARMGSRHPGLEILAVSIDEDPSKARAFLKGRGGRDSSLAALHDAGRAVAARYDLAGMPAAVLIDRKGVLRARYDGYTERDLERMEADIRGLLEEKP